MFHCECVCVVLVQYVHVQEQQAYTAKTGVVDYILVCDCIHFVSNQIKSKCRYLTCYQKLAGSQFSLLHVLK